MRLEDWQKWLDSQFVDAEEAQKQAESAAPVEESPVAHGMVAPPPTASTAPPVVEHVAPPTPPQSTPLPRYQEPPAPQQAATSVQPSSTPPVASASGVVDDIDVPSIERYMPFLRQAPSHAATEPEPPAVSAPTSGQAEAPTVEAAPAEAAIEENASSEEFQAVAEAKAEAKAEPSAIETDEQPELPLSAQTEDEQEDAASEGHAATTDDRNGLSRAATVTHKRARHARNVRPAEIVQELADGGLWNLVPKHIQVLVAMGSDDEVTQKSYKRSFKENRLELIDRLLDPTLSLEDTARLLNVCPTTVRRYTNRGLLTHQRTPGDQRRFKLSDVLAFLEAQSRAR